jgi:hypothetical protein
MESADAVRKQKILDGLNDGTLEAEHPIRVEIRLSRKIEIHVIDVEIRDQKIPVPQRALNFAPLLEPLKQLPRRAVLNDELW